MILETGRLILRPYLPADAEDVHVYGSDPEVCRYTDFGPNTWEDTLAFLTSVTDPACLSLDFALVLKETGRVVGGISARPTDDGGRELGWILRKDLWGRELTTEAAQALLAHLDSRDDVASVRARCRPENTASARVMEKIGMRLVRRIERDYECRGQWVDSLLYEREPPA